MNCHLCSQPEEPKAMRADGCRMCRSLQAKRRAEIFGGNMPVVSLDYDDYQVREFLREKWAAFHQYERDHARHMRITGLGDWHFLRASPRKKVAA